VDDCGGLQGVSLAFVLHIPAGDPAQFAIDVLRQPVQGCFVTAAPGFQQTVISVERASMDSSFSLWAPKYFQTWPLLPSTSACISSRESRRSE
jgi:hypothetical protein